MSGFKLINDRPIKSNELYSLFQTMNDKGQVFYAKIFSTHKIQQYNLEESIQYNQEVLSDLQGELFPQNFNKIISSIPNEGFYTFVTEPFEMNLQEYMHKNLINQTQAFRIFDNVLKAVYSLYSNGYWHKNIRAEHFVKVGNIWKLDSLVYYEDFLISEKLKSQYTFNTSYQPPQMYVKNIKTITDNDSFPIVVWNLGSLLLDLFFSVHKLNSYDILKLYKNQKFTLEAIKVKKVDMISNKLKSILAQMLHHDSKYRMKLQDVFANQLLSRQVSRNFKQKSKKGILGSINFRIFTGGKSALSSARFCKQLREKGDKQFHISQVVKSKLNKKNTLQIIQVQTSNQSNVSTLNVLQNLCRAKIKVIKSIFIKQPQNFEQLLKNKQFNQLVRKYKLHYDKSQILSFVGTKFFQINYIQNPLQMILLSKYSVNSVALMNLYKLAQTLETPSAFKEFDFTYDENFQNSMQNRVLKKIVHKKITQITKQMTNITFQISNLLQNQKNLLKQIQIQKFINKDLKIIDFNQIKSTYRKILKISYDTVTKRFNDQNSQSSARLAMHIVYCLSIDKLYLPHSIEDNFSYFFSWDKQMLKYFVTFEDFKCYVEQAQVKTLISHARKILEKYFKI